MSAEQQAIIEFVNDCIDPKPDASLVLQYLNSIQHRFRYVPEVAIQALSKRLSLARGEIDALISFYSLAPMILAITIS